MFKRLVLALVAVIAFANVAFAGVEANTADRAALDSIKDIGPKTAEAIVVERTKGGPFKDWNDLIHRVKGVGPHNAAKMSAAGLTVNSLPLANAPAKGTMKKADAPKDKAPVAAPAAAAPATAPAAAAAATPASKK
jgi:competence protein ComEA